MEIKKLKNTQFCDNEYFYLSVLQYYFLILNVNKNHSFVYSHWKKNIFAREGSKISAD